MCLPLTTVLLQKNVALSLVITNANMNGLFSAGDEQSFSLCTMMLSFVMMEIVLSLAVLLTLMKMSGSPQRSQPLLHVLKGWKKVGQ